MADEDKRNPEDQVTDEQDDAQDPSQVEADDELDQDEDEEGRESIQDELKRVVQVNLEDVGTLRKKMTVTIPRDTIDARLDEQYTDLRKEAVVPGFRRGRAPRRLLEKRFGGEVGETLVQQLVSAGYMAASEKEDLKIIGDPLVWAREKEAESDSLVDVQKAIDLMEIPDEGDFSFACEIELRPEFELPELDNIPVTKPVLSVSDEDVQTQIDRIRAGQGNYESAAEDAIQDDDLVTADMKMTCEGTVLKEQEDASLAARPQQVDGVNLENLGEALQGKKVGETATVSGTISDDYIKQEFRGKTADFELAIKDIRRLKLPELNDEFIKTWGFESEDEFRNYVRQELESRIGEEVRRGMEGQVYQYLLDKTSFDVPDRLGDRQAGRVLMRRMLEMYQQGVPQQEVEKHLDEMKASSKEDTIRDLKIYFIMESLSEKIEVDVSESELNGVIAGIAQRQGRRFDRVRDELAKEDRLMNLYLQIRDRKIIDQLLEKAKVEEKDVEVSDKGEGDKPKSKKKKASKKAKEKPEENADET